MINYTSKIELPDSDAHLGPLATLVRGSRCFSLRLLPFGLLYYFALICRLPKRRFPSDLTS